MWWTCEYCDDGAEYYSDRAFSTHFRDFHVECTIKCPDCLHQFHHGRNCTEHRIEKHGYILPEPALLRCNHSVHASPLTFKSAKAIRAHNSRKHPDCQYECTNSRYINVFKTKNLSNDHISRCQL